MQDNVIQVITDSLYLIAMINPISKVSVLSVFESDNLRGGLKTVTIKSSCVAAAILLGAMIFGDFLLIKIFHVKLHSLRLAGGLILLWVGFNALRKGVFFEQNTNSKFQDIAMVPLACPMIAGPATIAACFALRAKEGLFQPSVALIMAIIANYFIMRSSHFIAKNLIRFNVLGAIIRITGLIVMTMGTQMALDGLANWQHAAK